MSDKKMNLPLVALRGMVLLPGMVAHFDVSREKSIRAIEKAMQTDEKGFLITQKNPEKDDPELEDLYEMGVISYVKQVIKMPNNMIRVLTEGMERARIQEFLPQEDYLSANVEPIEEGTSVLEKEAVSAMIRSLKENMVRYGTANGRVGKFFTSSTCF